MDFREMILFRQKELIRDMTEAEDIPVYIPFD